MSKRTVDPETVDRDMAQPMLYRLEYAGICEVELNAARDGLEFYVPDDETEPVILTKKEAKQLVKELQAIIKHMVD